MNDSQSKICIILTLTHNSYSHVNVKVHPRISEISMAKTLTQGYSTNSSFSEANAIKVYRPGTTRTGPGSPLEAWSAFKKRVHAQDLPGMRRIVYSLNRDSYEEILQNVGPQKFENLVTSFTNLEVISLYEDCAQYASEIVTDQGTVTFFLDFVQGEQGWEVYSF